MTTLQLVFVVVAVSAAALVLVGAFVASRALNRAGAALRETSQRVSATADGLPQRVSDGRSQLGAVERQVEQALVESR